MLKQFITHLSHLIYPPHCLICKNYIHDDSPKGFVCLSCLANLPLNKPPFCLKCSRHIEGTNYTQTCKNCRKYPIEFDFAWSSSLYCETNKELLLKFKFHQKTYLRHVLADQMIRFINIYNLDIHQFDAIVPIPLYNSRLRERGYNQSLLLASKISNHFKIPILAKTLIRQQYTEFQSHTKPKNRWTNVTGAFTIKHSSTVNNKNILIIDDLLTTGATSSIAAKTLKASGANTVGVLTFAISH